VRPARVRTLLGYAVSDDEMVAILERLSCAVKREGGALQVTPPTWRFDLAIEEDFVEEVARIKGYDHVPSHPPRASVRMLSPTISENVFWSLVTPNGGEVIGDY
jgi:phenylalanyl-tRNA synthetase beta chain